MTYKTVLTVFAIGLIALAAGWGIGRLTVSTGRETAMEKYDLIPRKDLFDLKNKHDKLQSEIDQLKLANNQVSKKRDELVKQVASLTKKSESQAKAVAGNPPEKVNGLPIAFGKYADLDAIKNSDWHDIAHAVDKINKLITELVELDKKGLPPPADFQANIMKENQRLQKLAGGLMGNIPTHRMGNGEFTHPLVLSNILAAMLDNSEIPLDEKQLSEITKIGSGFDAEYDRIQKSYTEKTPGLEKFVDELILKNNTIEGMLGLLSPEQRDIVAPADIHGRLGADCISPALMAVLYAQPKNMSSREQFKSTAPKYFSDKYQLNKQQTEEASNLFNNWYKDIEPVLKKAEEPKVPLHIDNMIKAGIAKVNLLRGLLEIPGLSDKTRTAILGDVTWQVPRLTKISTPQKKG